MVGRDQSSAKYAHSVDGGAANSDDADTTGRDQHVPYDLRGKVRPEFCRFALVDDVLSRVVVAGHDNGERHGRRRHRQYGW